MTNHLNKPLAYASDFLTFLFLEKGAGKIRSIYLFGSAVRGELEKESDIDIFIDCSTRDEDEIIKTSKLAQSKFKQSKDFEKWKNFRFSYPISIKSGPLQEWGLRQSILSEGILLFSKTVMPVSVEKIVLFSIQFPEKRKDYLKITRLLFGRHEKGYSDPGLVSFANGEKLGSNVFTVPKLSQGEFIKLLHENKTEFKMVELSKQVV